MSKGAGVTFAVSDKPICQTPPQTKSVSEHLSRGAGSVIKATGETGRFEPLHGNGFVGAALTAYNLHYHLVLTPDQVWVAITTAFSNYVDRHAEEMRSFFVEHEGQKELKVRGQGTLTTANYDQLLTKISDLVDQNTKNDVRKWLECDFSTSTSLDRIVSKVVLMGAMKNYFKYKMYLLCGLPAVTLKGTLADWKEIRSRVDRIGTYNQPELDQWHKVLCPVIDEFIKAYQGEVDKDFWNRIACQTGGGSGGPFLKGWILSFIPWNDDGNMILSRQEDIVATKSYGKMNIHDIPASAVEVPVEIDDNGTIYQTIFMAGCLMSAFDETNQSISPALDWILFDKAKCENK